MSYKKAIEQINQNRRDALTRAELFSKELFDTNPDYRKAESDYRGAVIDSLDGKCTKANVAALKKVRDGIIAQLKVGDLLYPPFNCKKCNDTGLRLSDGKICSCAKNLTITLSGDNIEIPLQSFEDINYSLFSDEVCQSFRRTAEELKIIINKGEDSKKKNINLLGGTGTGKTFLAACTANEALLLSRSVIFLTSFTLTNRLLKFHTSFDDNKLDVLSPILDCDLLIIDDLGTESIYKNVTVEYLFHIINVRQLKNRHTFVTSNLTIDQLAARYGERMASRLFDKRLSYVKEFNFDNIKRLNI